MFRNVHYFAHLNFALALLSASIVHAGGSTNAVGNEVEIISMVVTLTNLIVYNRSDALLLLHCFISFGCLHSFGYSVKELLYCVSWLAQFHVFLENGGYFS